MPGSGGSVSDAPVNKVVDGKSHYLAYITPDEGKSLVNQGGKEVITDSGIPAYPPPTGTAEEASAYSGVAMGGEAGSGSDAALPPQLGGSSTVEQAEQFQDTSGQQETKESLITKVKNNIISKTDALNLASKFGWLKDNAVIDVLGGTFAIAMGIGGEAQEKAMTWGLENRLKSIQKQKDFHPGAYGYKISDIQSDIEGIKDGTFTQKDYTAKYGSGDTSNPLDKSYIPPTGGDNERGLTNIITPYAAHAIGGTTQQPSMASQWYAGLGGGPSNPGAFNLTQQYALAKAKVSQRLRNSTSVGQMAINNSPFFNFLKDNSLDKGIL